jgi:hypothetical protein
MGAQVEETGCSQDWLPHKANLPTVSESVNYRDEAYTTLTPRR